MRTQPAKLFFALLLGLAAPGLLAAAEPDTSRWKCRSCTTPEGWELSTDVGAIYVSDDAPKFGEYTGLEEEGGYADLNLDVRRWGSAGRYLELTGTDLALDSRYLGFEAGRQGTWSASAFWDEIPQFRYDTTRTPFLGAGSGWQTLPEGWVAAPNTRRMTALGDSLRGIDIERERETLGLGAELLPWRELKLSADFRHQERDGSRIQGASLLTAAAQLAAPVDYSTDEIELAAAYGRPNWNAELRYYGSFFEDDTQRLAWDSPYTPILGADRGRLAGAPESDFQQVSLSGAWQLARRTTLSGSAALGRIEQDQAFLPYTVNRDLTTPALPRRSFDGEVDTTNYSVRLNSSPWRRLKLNAEYRYDERDNGSPQDTYQYVVTDVILGAPVTNLPYSYERDVYEVSAELSVLRKPLWIIDRARVEAGFKHEEMDRDFQERRQTENDRYWGKIRLNLGPLLEGYYLYAYEERDGSEYETLEDLTAPQNPLMRKYHLADRERDIYEVRLTSSPVEIASFGFTSRFAYDDYEESAVGLIEADDRSFTFDATFALADNVSLYGAYTWERIDSEQAGSQSFGQPDWRGSAQDQFDTVIVGLDLPEITDRIDLRVDYTYTRSVGETAMNVSGLDRPFPDLRTRLHSVRASLDYAWRDNLDVTFGYWYERYATDDWALDRVRPATVPNLLSLGAQSYDYSVNTVFLGFTYRP